MGLLRAIVLGADGACIDMSISSILPVIAVFMTAVVILQYLGKRVFVLLFRRERPAARVERPTRAAAPIPPVETPKRRPERRGEERPVRDKYKNGPILSNRRM